MLYRDDGYRTNNQEEEEWRFPDEAIEEKKRMNKNVV